MAPTAIRIEALKEGKRYRVVYAIPGYRLSREMVANYIGADAKGAMLFFDLRPAAGTQPMATEWITEIWETDRKLQLPTTYRGETRVF